MFKTEVKDHILRELTTIQNPRVLDVGIGCGTYSDLLQVPMDGVEIYEPYIERFNLRSKYNHIYIDDIFNIDTSQYDYVILGDVLEHIDTYRAQVIVDRLNMSGTKCLIAVPYNYEQGEWEGNVYETHHQPDLTPEVMLQRYGNLSLLCGNHEYGYYINYKPFVAPNLIISSGRRYKYFLKTMATLKDKNPSYYTDFNQVWVLDDRSTSHDRYAMDMYMKKMFPNKYHMITFNSDAHFAYVDKFNMIQQLMGESEYVFLLEDDWVSIEPLDMMSHIQYMNSHPSVSQIMFSQPFDLQWPEIQVKSSVNDVYWRNPWPDKYKHIRGFQDGYFIWNEVYNQHYGNNPSLFRRRVFEGKQFVNDHGWECRFADEFASQERLMYLTKKHLFNHIGEESLTAV